ncbi:MAG: methylenetetrahydrofolate reductase C-terminal domain-containing protein, partial [Sedimentisphaerales bacterium]|nr:methylenetetrahydrofolate reductase C-terminal domain-containing protein [Sedimentisphaerales bacterium]
LWQDLDVVPHITAKDHNVDAIKTYIIGLQKLGLESVLALTGDKPAESKGVFEIDSIGLVELITAMNQQAFEKAKPDSFDKVHQFYIAAAVSPFKYTEASLMQQYYKMAKKIHAGADCLITQMGWDTRKSEELFRYLKDENINVPVFGNVYFLTTMTPAPRLMREGKLPGCVVTDELFGRLSSENPAQHLERAAQQVAMYRDLGAVGVDLGGIFDFDMLLKIMNRAKEIGHNWREYRDNLDFGLETVLLKTGPNAGKRQPGFYLYDTNGSRRLPSHPRPTFNKRSFDLFHNVFLEPGRGLYPALKRTLGMSKGLRENKGCLYKMFFAGFEKPIKTMLFDCEECGDCFLVENFGICSMGKCEKGLANPPCGDAEPDGTCGNNPDIQCVGELIYNAAASECTEGTADSEWQSGLKKLRHMISPPRLQALENTSSILNYLFGRDHTRKLDFLQIAENLNAYLPKAYAAMRQLLELRPGAFERPSPALNYLISLIEA